jgi:hypothetical protein
VSAPVAQNAAAFIPPFPLPTERKVYRVTGWVPGLVTYFAITHLGEVLGGEFRCVTPGALNEARVLTELTDRLDAYDGHVTIRPPLTLHRRDPFSVAASLCASRHPAR